MVSDQVIITGANGLVGSYVTEQLKKKYLPVSLDISDPIQPVDITDESAVMKAVGSSQSQFVIHFAAFTDVTAAWEQSGNKDGIAYKVNVLGTQHLVKACNEFGKHFIHTSTAYVFDGEKAEPYVEEDTPNPIEWYGETKAMAENYIQERSTSWTIFRIDQPFRPDKFAKLDLPHKIIEQLKTDSLQPQFIDHYFGPTWIPDYAKTIDWAIRTKPKGVFHATNGESWNNYDFATEIARAIHSNVPVKHSNLAEYLKEQKRPYQKNTALNCSKLQLAIDFKQVSVMEAISLLES